MAKNELIVKIAKTDVDSVFLCICLCSYSYIYHIYSIFSTGSHEVNNFSWHRNQTQKEVIL